MELKSFWSDEDEEWRYRDLATATAEVLEDAGFTATADFDKVFVACDGRRYGYIEIECEGSDPFNWNTLDRQKGMVRDAVRRAIR